MQHKRILIVDDDEAIRAVLADLFQEEGYSVKTAANGRQALAAVAYVTYDVLLTDLDMPVLDGLELARALKAQHISISGGPHGRIAEWSVEITRYRRRGVPSETVRHRDRGIHGRGRREVRRPDHPKFVNDHEAVASHAS